MSQNTDLDLSVLHPETEDAVDAFTAALKEKLRRVQMKRGHTTGWKYNDWRRECLSELRRHVDKGDPLDVAAYAMFCFHRGWKISE